MEKENLERAKTILEEIEKLTNEYNTLNLKDKIVVERKTRGERKSVKNLYVCEYNRDSVGLFNRIDYRETCSYANFSCFEGQEPNGYDAGTIFVENNSNHIGIYESHKGLLSWANWKEEGTKVYTRGKYYVANCNMHQAYLFDEIREKMKENNVIDFFEPGIANDDEIEEVLKYTYKTLIEDRYKKEEKPVQKRFSLFSKK